MDVNGKYHVTLATLVEGIVVPCLGAMLAMAGYVPCLQKNTNMFVLSRVYAGPVLCSHLATCRVKVGGKLVEMQVMMAMMVIMMTTTARIMIRIMMIIVIYCHHYTS